MVSFSGQTTNSHGAALNGKHSFLKRTQNGASMMQALGILSRIVSVPPLAAYSLIRKCSNERKIRQRIVSETLKCSVEGNQAHLS